MLKATWELVQLWLYIICCWRLCTHTLYFGFAAANAITSTIAMGVFSYRQIILLLPLLPPPPPLFPPLLLLLNLPPPILPASSSPLPHPPLFSLLLPLPPLLRLNEPLRNGSTCDAE